MLGTSRFYRAVRQFAVSTPIWAEKIVYEVAPDERHDITLVAARVYGDRREWLTVMAAAGLDRVDNALTERTLVLPTKAQLERIKADTGYGA
jgi:hypothetical protein